LSTGHVNEMSLFGLEIGSFVLDAQVDLLGGLEDKVDQRDEPPNNGPHDEEVLPEHPLVELHVAHLNEEDLSHFGPAQVPTEHLS